MMTPQQLDALTEEEFADRINQQPLSDFYLETMRWVWSTEPWKNSPGGWSWETVMQGYTRIREMEANGDLKPVEQS